jgi:hypothetical protein
MSPGAPGFGMAARVEMDTDFLAQLKAGGIRCARLDSLSSLTKPRENGPAPPDAEPSPARGDGGFGFEIGCAPLKKWPECGLAKMLPSEIYARAG